MKQKHFQSEDFHNMTKSYRVNLINSLGGFKSVNLVGTVDNNGITNLSVVSSVVHLGANPALMGFIIRPITVTRDTYNNILTNGSFTFNHITSDIMKPGHQSSARYPAEVSEFGEVGLTAEFGKHIKAPYVKESKIKVGLQFREKMEIKLNGTVFIIGEVVELFIPEPALGKDGLLDIEMAGSITVSGLDSYHSTKRLARLAYAKPEIELKEI